MGFNWRAALRGAAESVSQTADVMLTDAVQQQREQRMAKLHHQQTVEQRSYDAGLLQDQRAFELEAATQKAGAQARSKAEQRSYEQGLLAEKRAYDAAQSQVEFEREQAGRLSLAEFKAENDPRAAENNITVNTGENVDARRKKVAEALGSADADMIATTRKAVASAADLEDSLQVLEDMQKQFDTGKTQDALAILGQYAGTDAGAARQAWEGTISPIVLAKAEGLSGVLSDKDMEFLRASVPQFSNDSRANKIMIGIMRKGMERARENDIAMQAHLREHGSLSGFVMPNRQSINETPDAQSNIGAADDPLGLF